MTTTTWEAREDAVHAALAPEGLRHERTTESEYGSKKLWYRIGDRVRLVADWGNEAFDLYVFAPVPAGAKSRTAVDHGILDYEVHLGGGVPVPVVLASVRAAVKEAQ